MRSVAVVLLCLAACGPKGGTPSEAPPSNQTEPSKQVEAPSGQGVVRTTIVDAATGEPLAGATVVIGDLQYDDVAGPDGVSRLTVPGGTYDVTVYYADLTTRVTGVPVSPHEETAVCVGLSTATAGG